MAVNKRKPVNYESSSPSISEPQIPQSTASSPPPSLPTRSDALPTTSTTAPSQPPLPKRGAGTINTSSHTKQWTNSSASSSNFETNTLSTSSRLTASQSSSSLDMPNFAHGNTLHKRPLFLNTPKRLFAGDSTRNTNLAQLDVATSIIDDFVSTSGLSKNGMSIKKHVRHATRNIDDDASVDSGKSTRDSEAANRIKQVYMELESLRKKNDILEKVLKEKNINVDQIESVGISTDASADVADENASTKPINPLVEKWNSIEECTIKILNTLGIDKDGNSSDPPTSTDPVVVVEKPKGPEETKDEKKPELFKQPHTPDLPPPKQRPATVHHKMKDGNVSLKKTVDSIKLDLEPEKSLLNEEKSPGKSASTLSKDAQNKLNQKADNLLSAIKQEQTKIKKRDDINSSPPKKAASASVIPQPDKIVAPTSTETDKSLSSETMLNMLGGSKSGISLDLPEIPIDLHVSSASANSNKSVMDTFEQDLMSIMDDFGF